MKELENLRALVYGKELNSYQKALAIQEFEQLTNPQPSETKDVNWMDNDWSYQDDEWGDGEDIKWDNDAIEFAEWLNNNFYIPDENGMWRIMVEHIEYQGKKPKVNIFSTEELYELFTSQKSNNK